MQFGRKVALALVGASTLMVAGCATETTYRPATGTGFYRTGYSDQQLEPGRFIVSFAGNTVTSRDTVERYLLFRAAQLTLERRGVLLRNRRFRAGDVGGQAGAAIGQQARARGGDHLALRRQPVQQRVAHLAVAADHQVLHPA